MKLYKDISIPVERIICKQLHVNGKQELVQGLEQQVRMRFDALVD